MATSTTQVLLNLYLTIFLAVLCERALCGPLNKTNYFGNGPQPRFDDKAGRFKENNQQLNRRAGNVDVGIKPPADRMQFKPKVNPMVQENSNRNPAYKVAPKEHLQHLQPVPAGAGELHSTSQPRKLMPVKIIDHPDCADDAKRLCSAKTVASNNFAILECLAEEVKSDSDLSVKCQHFIWQYKNNLTKDIRFDSATSEVCKSTLEQLPECNKLPHGKGQVIPCLIDNQENVSDNNCKLFLRKMSYIIFGDYRLIYKLVEKCQADIETQGCGRVTMIDQDATHSQGKTLECLSSKVDKLNKDCKHEILRIAELQADDYHMDRPLFFACREDREAFCDDVKAGGGKVFKCLYKHKFEKGMSEECQKQLVRRQKMIQEDYKINKAFANQCNADIERQKCLGDDAPKYEKGRLAHVLLCLESASKDGVELQPECIREMKDIRRSLMEDFQISPEIVKGCSVEIKQYCGKLHRHGKTLHCLMNLARPQIQDEEEAKGHKKLERKASPQCQRALESLLKEADVEEDYRLDPALTEACQPVIDIACSDISPGEGQVIGCLLEHIDTDKMQDECQKHLLELQYFISRDFELDPALYKQCHLDATKLCSAPKEWFDQDTAGPEQGPLIFNCLYNHLKRHSTDSEKQLTRGCSFEVKRVLHQRAIRVELEPRIQEPCMHDLSQLCSEKTDIGEEIDCLQMNYEALSTDCKAAIGNYTEDMEVIPELDRMLMKSCTPMIKMFCKDEMEQDSDPGGVMECLINYKNDPDMNEKCRVGIEHHQLISIKDYRFSYKFKEACKPTVVKECPGVRSKADVIKCLSEIVREDTLRERKHKIPKKCRKQLKFELLQREENVKLDEELEAKCEKDMNTLCSNVVPGKGHMLECLKKHQDELSRPCHKLIFKREKLEAYDQEIDYKLMHVCKKMIKTYCKGEKPHEILECLKRNKEEENFDEHCLDLVMEREEMQNKDYRLNVELQEKCTPDINKYCSDLIKNQKEDEETEGKVITCLRVRFAQKRLSTPCRKYMTNLIRDSQLDYRQDPVLAKACDQEIKDHCIEHIPISEGSEFDHSGLLEDCLKNALAAGKITKPVCQKEVARLLAESLADVHVDPLLHRACALDIKYYCVDVPPGEGKQMSCLLAGLEDPKVKLNPKCHQMLADRKKMWEYAARVAPPETFQEVYDGLATSPSKHYFLGIIFAVIGFIFVGGLFCGRVTKRVTYNQKNK